MEASIGNDVGYLQIAGFWRRSTAFVLDFIILGIAGAMLGAILFDPLARMGGYALLIGFAIALAYFGIGNSVLMDGQTLGKKVMGVRVVDAQGGRLPLPRSLLRYVVLGSPFFLSAVPIPLTSAEQPWAYLIGIVSSIVGLTVLYLYVFNRITRQSLHDIVAKSYVVRVSGQPQVASFGAMWRGHWIVLALVVALAASVPFAAQRLTGGLFKELWSVATQLSVQPHVRRVAVTKSTFSMNGRRPTHSVVATLWLDSPMVEDADMARRLAGVIGASKLDLSGQDGVVVVLNYGYDMGIAHFWKTRRYVYKPLELMLDAPATPTQ